MLGALKKYSILEFQAGRCGICGLNNVGQFYQTISQLNNDFEWANTKGQFTKGQVISEAIFGFNSPKICISALASKMGQIKKIKTLNIKKALYEVPPSMIMCILFLFNPF